ncbi:ty3-gypsy retrotransposon protein [Cucumis melo var. makuwa]|uniref:Ty3-gypsy retrotransposon protein n=1 Tax=Cucumis melo var. makuwa TaxID=1194695 RepID=A0A5A7T813_CUCMM|nr:ty3-gypsy retrotransposon protein [Cucumis melo var. makuwa]TYK01702.1 ty3-gypsy retrotransposon protein [Cucumis melo var. makuwa]
MLMKAVEERDFEIASLKNHIESRDDAESSLTHTIKNVDKVKSIMQESQPHVRPTAREATYSTARMQTTKTSKKSK